MVSKCLSSAWESSIKTSENKKIEQLLNRLTKQ